MFPRRKKPHAAEWLRGAFFISTVSLNTPYQNLGDIQRSSRKLSLPFADFFRLPKKGQNYSQKVRILEENGTMLAPRHLRKFEARSLLQIFGGKLWHKIR